MLINKVQRLTKLSRDSPRKDEHKREISFDEVLQNEVEKLRRKESENGNDTLRYPVGR